MKGAWEYLQERANEDWLIDQENRSFFELTRQMIAELRQEKRSPHPPVIFLAEPDPIHFLAKFIAACTTDCHLFLCNPTWTDPEWAQVRALAPSPLAPCPLPLICIPTGGSSGSIRFAMHTWETLMASVRGFQQYFGVEQIHSCCVLPLYHVSGLMQFLRSLTVGGKFALLSYKNLESSQLSFDPADFFLSLVPTQLQRLIGSPILPHFKTILLGGAPASSELLEQARRLNLPLAPTYGMTETASQVATLKPADFLQGVTGCGQTLPHAQITICSATTGEAMGANQTGVVTIAAKSLALGYYPALFGESTSHDVACFPKEIGVRAFSTDDLGWLDEHGYLHIVGRQTDKIITGGENVFPAEVEAAIWATGLVQDVAVIGVSDRQWGEAIAALYIPTAANLTGIILKSAVEKHLSKFKLPKYWIAVEQLPRNAQGKLNRQELRQLVPSTDLTK